MSKTEYPSEYIWFSISLESVQNRDEFHNKILNCYFDGGQ